jgi:hypothetical protein
MDVIDLGCRMSDVGCYKKGSMLICVGVTNLNDPRGIAYL